MNVKSITLTVAEVTEILSITDDTLRRQALEAVTEAAAHPEKINLEAHLDGPSIILTLVHKVYRRYETALLRAENRKKKKAGNEDANPFAAMLNESFSQLAELVKSYLKPLIEYASGYYRMPKGQRDGTFTMPVDFA